MAITEFPIPTVPLQDLLNSAITQMQAKLDLAQTAADEAQTADAEAQTAAAEAQTAADEAQNVVATYFPTVAAALADVTAWPTNTILNARTGEAWQVVASGQDITRGDGVKLLVISDRQNILAFGAAGDGATNTAAQINARNVAGTVVDLGGKDHAYTGAFQPVANFRNGRILSSINGTFDYRTTDITADITVTVGALGTIKRLDAALRWLQSLRITGSVTLTLLNHTSVEDATGDMSLNNFVFDHPDSRRVIISAGAVVGGVPTSADMTGTRATDEIIIRARFAASVFLVGPDDITGVSGVSFPHGLKLWENVAVISRARYSFDVGYNGSHGSTGAGGQIKFGAVAFSGGVWGLIASMASVTFVGAALFCHQISGGPMGLIGCLARIEVADMHLYTPPGVKTALGPKYGVYLENGSLFLFSSGRLKIKGAFLHGAMVKNGSELQAEASLFDGVSNAITVEPGSTANIRNSTIQNGDKANTALVTGGAQIGYWDNNGSNALIHAGLGAKVAIGGVTITNCINSYAVHSIGGQIAGVTALTVTGSKWTNAFARFYGSTANYIAANVSTPQAGSLDQCLAYAVSTVRVGTNSGLTFSPAVNTVSNGNVFATTG